MPPMRVRASARALRCRAISIPPRCSRRPSACAREARRVLDAFGPAPGHVFNLGHGISPDASIDSVAALVDEVRTYSLKMRERRAKNCLTYSHD